MKVLENPWKVLEFKSCKFWHFAFVDNFEAVFQYELQTNWWRQSVTCFYHYGIGEYSTVHFSVTLQSKFWMSTSTIWLFVDNFGAWRMQVGSWKSLKSAWILYFKFATNPVWQSVLLIGSPGESYGPLHQQRRKPDGRKRWAGNAVWQTDNGWQNADDFCSYVAHMLVWLCVPRVCSNFRPWSLFFSDFVSVG